MNIILLFNFILLITAEKAFVVDNGSKFTKIIPGDCNYWVGTYFSVEVGENNKPIVTTYEKENCKGKKSHPESFQWNFGTYQEAPKHAGFVNYMDDVNCSHEKYNVRTYFKAECFSYFNQWGIYVEKDNTLKLQKYSDEKCQNKDGEPQPVSGFGECNKCVVNTLNVSDRGVKYQCGSFSIMIMVFVTIFIMLI